MKYGISGYKIRHISPCCSGSARVDIEIAQASCFSLIWTSTTAEGMYLVFWMI